MGPIENLTTFGLGALPNVDRHGEEIAVIGLAAHFEMPGPGRPGAAGDLIAVAEQAPPHWGDVYWEDAYPHLELGTLRYEGQGAFARPGTDVYLNGSAWAPGGVATTAMDVAMMVGGVRQYARVFGDRIWVRSVSEVVPSDPTNFRRIPLRWERAFGGGNVEAGGRGFEPRNPAGVGLYESMGAATDRPLPNIEDPRGLLSRLGARVRPVGFGATGRHWLPRASFAGTYDEAWKRERAPLWPDDLDERFFMAAAPELCAAPHLGGGEPVVLQGMHPAGEIRFSLPTLRLSCKSVFRSGATRTTMSLDAVILEPDLARFTMVYRAILTLGRAGAEHRYSVVRALEDWEAAPAPARAQPGGSRR